MGIFQHKQLQKKSSNDPASDAVEHFFDESLREDLREQGRIYFERVINENAALFKQDLDATIAHINTELKQHMARQLDVQVTQLNATTKELKDHIASQLDNQMAEFGQTIKDSQAVALQALSQSAQALQQQHQQLGQTLQKSVAEQETKLAGVFKENMTEIIAMKDAQALALQSLNRSAEVLKEQYEQLNTMLTKSITDQESMIINVFEQNMAQVVEHYLLGALGDQYDLKAQLPSIIKQMELSKQDIMDDMKL